METDRSNEVARLTCSRPAAGFNKIPISHLPRHARPAAKPEPPEPQLRQHLATIHRCPHLLPPTQLDLPTARGGILRRGPVRCTRGCTVGWADGRVGGWPVRSARVTQAAGGVVGDADFAAAAQARDDGARLLALCAGDAAGDEPLHRRVCHWIKLADVATARETQSTRVGCASVRLAYKKLDRCR